jgi:hypothetical protein
MKGLLKQSIVENNSFIKSKNIVETFLAIWLTPIIILFLIFLYEVHITILENQELLNSINLNEFVKELKRLINLTPFVMVSIPVIGGLWLLIEILIMCFGDEINKSTRFGRLLLMIEKILFKINFKIETIFKK